MKILGRSAWTTILLAGTIFSLILAEQLSCAKDLGTFGATYPIAEKDALKEIEQKAAQANISKFINKKKLVSRINSFKPSGLAEVRDIGPARADRTFLVDMTYTLSYDIPDGQGGILYPKGYTFNPLDYIAYPHTLVILNGMSPKQVVWFRVSEYMKDYKVKLIITDGSYRELSKSLKRPVFYASRAIINAFQIKAVPSVVRQKGNMMEVTEIAVGKQKIR